MDIPNLDNLIKSLECDTWESKKCMQCPYNYQHLDDSGDTSFWRCDDDKQLEDILFYLKLYQYLINQVDYST